MAIPPLDGSPPRRPAALGAAVGQMGQPLGQVGHHAEVDADRTADRRRVDVDVHDPGAGREPIGTADDAVVEAHAETDHEVGLLDREVGALRAVHARHPHGPLVLTGERVQGEERGRDGDVRPRREPGQRALHARQDDAPSGEDQGPFRLIQPPGHSSQLHTRVGLREALRAPTHRRRRIGGGLRLDVLRDVDDHGAGTPGPCDPERLAHDVGDLGRAPHEEAVFRDGRRDAENVGLLEGEGAQDAPGDLTRDRDDGHAVHERGGQTGDEVGGPGAARRDADTHASGRTGIPVRCVGRRLLVATEYVAEIRPTVQSVVERQDRAPWVSEQHGHSLFQQGSADLVGAGARGHGVGLLHGGEKKPGPLFARGPGGGSELVRPVSRSRSATRPRRRAVLRGPAR